MKTVKEWCNSYEDGDDSLPELIVLIQADALRHAAELSKGNWDFITYFKLLEEADKLEKK